MHIHRDDVKVFFLAEVENLLVGDEDLPSADDLSKRYALVALPLLDSIGTVDEDDKIVLLALVVDLGLSSVASHVC